MLKITNAEVVGWEHAIRGMRNPMNSWDKSDTSWVQVGYDDDSSDFIDYDMEWETKKVIGPNDADLMKRLCKGGPVHAKFRRMITVYVDVEAPLYWWKEYDTYKVGTVANSCSTMHKIHAKEFTVDDFSTEHLDQYNSTLFNMIIRNLNNARQAFLDTKNKESWWQMIQLLPTSYNQKRTLMLNYEVLVGIYRDRKNHKLDEWHTFCDWIENLPYSWIITGKEN